MITLTDYFGRMSHQFQPEPEVVSNAQVLLERVNALLAELQWKPNINSGWRSAAYNALVPNAAPKSKHITGQAIDLSDPDGELDQLLFDDQRLLVKHQLWLEHPLATKGYTHLQSVPPRSNNRVFFP
jgi:hypothetical protein